jgi:hypothetical protein
MIQSFYKIWWASFLVNFLGLLKTFVGQKYPEMRNFPLSCNEVSSKWLSFTFSGKENKVLLENNVKYIAFDDHF